MGISREEIRVAVREALQEAIPTKSNQRSRQQPNCQLMKQILATLSHGGQSSVVVDVSNDRKLNEFISELILCLQDENVGGLIRSKRLRFSQIAVESDKCEKDKKPTSMSNSAKGRKSLVDCLESGVLTESKLLMLSKNSNRIEIGLDVKLTPLAKERARLANIEIVRLNR